MTSWPIFHGPLTLDFGHIIKVKMFVQGRILNYTDASKLIFHMRMRPSETSRSIQELWPLDTFILDTPPHELLKSKLLSYEIGCKTLKWIDCFLCFRQQRVVVNGVKFDWTPVLSCFPQGTVLGLLLFSLYINGISSDIESEIRLFVDDCVCYREIKDEEDTMKLQRDVDRLGSWARKWGMRFQPVKCNMTQLTRKRIKKIHASYTLEVTDLENVESIKTSLTFKCLIEHLLADFSYSRPLDTYLWKQMMNMNRNITYKWCNIDKKHLLFTKRKCHKFPWLFTASRCSPRRRSICACRIACKVLVSIGL